MNNKNKARVNETSDSYVVQMAIPGVKVQHVTVEETNGEIEITAIRMNATGDDVDQTYQDVLYLKPSTADMTKATGTLNHGVLKLEVPKRTPPMLEVETETAVAPAPSAAEESSNQQFRVTFDLPGVPASQVRVKVFPEDHKLVVQGVRPRRSGDDKDIFFRRIFEIPQYDTVDMSLTRSFLLDGVFTLVMPSSADTMATDDDDQQDTTNNTRIIVVTTEEDNLPSVGNMSLNEGEKDWDHVVSDDVDVDKKPPAVEK
mmetsp:Transcript_16235/g.24033  ORF Transcript_16235/g.24033 Transcript_16235/m.24033 type:complete len:258 (-) Transcript_16235:124-897(-)